MTLDTVEWLRDQGQLLLDSGSQFDVFNGVRLIAAAAEIERLRAANEDLDMVASRAIDEIERLTAALQEIIDEDEAFIDEDGLMSTAVSVLFAQQALGQSDDL